MGESGKYQPESKWPLPGSKTKRDSDQDSEKQPKKRADRFLFSDNRHPEIRGQRKIKAENSGGLT